MEKEFKLGENQMSTNRDTVEINKRAILDILAEEIKRYCGEEE